MTVDDGARVELDVPVSRAFGAAPLRELRIAQNPRGRADQAGHQVHLTTTDPAANLTETLHGTVAGLQVSRIDPAAAVQAYRDHVMATKGKDLDEAGRAV